MIYELRRKFIRICSLSFLAVLLVMTAAICINNEIKQNRMLDMMADAISENGGVFPRHDTPAFAHLEQKQPVPDFINEETPFTTRFFEVKYNSDGTLECTNMDFVSGISLNEAESYAETVMHRSSSRGWYGEYRYKRYETENGAAVLFINGNMFRSTTNSYLFSTISVFAGGSLAVLLLIIIISKRAVRPVAESYEKQKQFITDANHELKTPLTLILTNVDIAESELGRNEWLEDIRTEGQRMSVLVNQLVTLTRMDEQQPFVKSDVNFSACTKETAEEFSELAELKGKQIVADIADNITLQGDEILLRQLLGILLDNAIKYSDAGSTIEVTLQKKRRITLCIRNAYSEVEQLHMDKLFNRFYRADPARTACSSFGVGLSIAKSITERHHGDIRAKRMDDCHIGFVVRF